LDGCVVAFDYWVVGGGVLWYFVGELVVFFDLFGAFVVE